MSTFADLTDRVIESLQSFTQDQDEQTFITSALDMTSLTFSVDEPKLISQGIVEIDDEQLWIKKVDNLTGVVTVSPFGRGYRSSQPSTHAQGARIIDSPLIPRITAKQAIQRCIDTIYPDIYVLKTMEFPYVAARQTYPMPANIDQIQEVTWQTIGPSRIWLPINRYRLTTQADLITWPTGKTLDLYQCPVPGQTILVSYISPPDNLVNDSDDFVTTTGFSITIEQAIIYGACAQLTSHIESARLNISSIEASIRSQVVAPGSAINLSKYYFGLYDMFVQQERERLLRIYPTTVHFKYI